MHPARTILIIGASSGIGRALALHYGRDPEIRLGLTARRLDKLREIAAQTACDCEVRRLDLAAPDRGRRFEELLSAYERIDLILYCAGFGEINPALDWPLCRETLEVNVMGFTEIVNLGYRFLARQKGGRLAAVSSVAGWRGAEDDSGYSASKSYIIRYMEGLARKARKEKSRVAVSTILPGFVDTAMAKGEGFFWMCSPETAAEQIAAGLRRGRRYLYVTRRWLLIAAVLRLLPWRLYERL